MNDYDLILFEKMVRERLEEQAMACTVTLIRYAGGVYEVGELIWN